MHAPPYHGRRGRASLVPHLAPGDPGRMGPNRTSLRFVVGTALLTATGTSTLAGCDKPAVNTPAPEGPSINTPPDRPESPETNPGEGPIVNTAAPTPDPVAPPEPDPGAKEPVVINTPGDVLPPEDTTPVTQPIVNTPAPKPKKPDAPRPKVIVNTRGDLKPEK